jgi:acetyl/propionyl-CoA carboxylase alpha subunit
LLQQQLNKVEILGIKTNLPLLKKILDNPQFKLAEFNTHFLQQQKINLTIENPQIVTVMAALFLVYSLQSNNTSPWQLHDGWRLNFPPFVQNYCP